MAVPGRRYVVGFTGAAGAGKTTTAGAVRERLIMPHTPVAVRTLKVAAPLNEALRCLGITKGGTAGEAAHPLYRDAAQHFYEWFAGHNPDWLVPLLQRAIATTPPGIILIDDVRRKAEAACCDLVVCCVTARPTLLTPAQQAHPTEQGWRTVVADMVFACDTLATLDATALAVAERVRWGWQPV